MSVHRGNAGKLFNDASNDIDFFGLIPYLLMPKFIRLLWERVHTNMLIARMACAGKTLLVIR